MVGSLHAANGLGWLDKSPDLDSIFACWPGADSPGAVVTIAREGTVLQEKAYGLANLRTKSRISAATSFHLASLTKPFTAMAIMMLCERGELTVDHPVSAFLHDFAAGLQRLTVRHLLNHTSGLPDYEEFFSECVPAPTDHDQKLPERSSYLKPDAETIVRMLARQELRFAPGDRWEYSNSGYVCLARIVELVSGMTFARFLRERIFLELGMESTQLYEEVQPEAAKHAVSYEREGDAYSEIEYSQLETVYGAEGMHSTSRDMVKWFRSLANDVLVKRSTLEQAFDSGRLNNGTRTGYGFGWFTARSHGLRRVSHTGSCGGFRNLVVYYPDLHLAMLVLSNFAEFDDVARSATALKLEQMCFTDRMRRPTDVSADLEHLNRYVGSYQLDSGEILSVAVEDGGLRVRPSHIVPIRLVPESDVKFVVQDAECDSYLFHIDKEGHVTGVARHLSLFGESPAAYCTAKRLS